LTGKAIFFRRLAPAVDAPATARAGPARSFFSPPWHAVRFQEGMSGRRTWPRNGRARARGTSLIEVLVAMALALQLIVGAAEMMTLALRAKRRGDIAAAISHAVTDRLEALKSRPFGDAALAAGAYAETVRREPGGCLMAESWEISDDAGGQKCVRLRVREAGRQGPETVAVLFISRDLGFRP
jgi:hypothetical protein